MDYPIRILHVVGKMHYGGMETLIMNIYRSIDRDKVQFDFMVHYNEPGEYDKEIKELGGKIYVMPNTIPINYFKYKKALNNFFSSNKKYKIIHSHLISTAFIYNRIAKKYGKKICITHSHSSSSETSLKSKISDVTSKLSENYTDIFFGCSKEACSYFFPKSVKKGINMTIIKNAIDSKKYSYNEYIRNKIRKDLQIEDKFVIGHIGRFSEHKNHDFLLDIFKEIYSNNNNSILILVGKGPLESKIKSKINNLGLSKNVIFLGVINDIYNILQAIDIFLFPSVSEGFGIALLEAQASGLKCFTSKDVVPLDVKVTNLLEYISLNSSSDIWANKILEYKFGYERKDTSKEIINSGYDIKSQSNWFQKFYIDLYKSI